MLQVLSDPDGTVVLTAKIDLVIGPRLALDELMASRRCSVECATGQWSTRKAMLANQPAGGMITNSSLNRLNAKRRRWTAGAWDRLGNSAV